MTDSFVEARHLAMTLPDAHINWQSIYLIDEESYTEAPDFLREIKDQLLVLEGTKAGQKLFRGILADPTKSSQARITAEESATMLFSGSPAAAEPNKNLLRLSPKLYNFFRDNPDIMLEKAPHAKFILTEPLAPLIAHESDHLINDNTRVAKNMSTDISRNGVIPSDDVLHALLSANSCSEEEAIHTGNLVRTELQLPLRDLLSHAGDAREQIAMSKDLLSEEAMYQFATLAVYNSKGCKVKNGEVSQSDIKSEVDDIIAEVTTPIMLTDSNFTNNEVEAVIASSIKKDNGAVSRSTPNTGPR